MATSAHRKRPRAATTRKGRRKCGFVVGKYFEMSPDGSPDYNGITRNIEAAVEWSVELWRHGFLVFTPHLNTHHFEAKTKIHEDPIQNEEFYRAFDRRLLADGIDFIFATPNWRRSSGGRLEIQLACHLGIPVFESVRDLLEWDSGGKNYSTVQYHTISKEAKDFGGADVKILLVEGPFWAEDGKELDMPRTRQFATAAEFVAIDLFNNRIAAFTPHLNTSFERLGFRVPDDLRSALSEHILRKVADGLYVIDGWQGYPDVRAHVRLANRLKKPVFESLNEACAWRDGSDDYFTVRSG